MLIKITYSNIGYIMTLAFISLSLSLVQNLLDVFIRRRFSSILSLVSFNCFSRPNFCVFKIAFFASSSLARLPPSTLIRSCLEISSRTHFNWISSPFVDSCNSSRSRSAIGVLSSRPLSCWYCDREELSHFDKRCNWILLIMTTK